MKTQMLMHPRAEELLVERALRPLTDAEAQELTALGVADDESLDLAAAALMIATTQYEAMPADLLERLAEPTVVAAPASMMTATLAGVVPPRPIATPATPATPAPVAPVAPPPADVIPITRPKRRVSVAWFAAAASIAIAIGAGLYARNAINGERASAPTRAELLANGERPLAWTATADAAARGASGDVVWSATQQRGYMRFVGLAANDRTAWQYQLWIFDRARDQAYPIDGGVFDVSSTGEVIVPITAKLHVDDATLFAVTVERPGGVVVSKRERIVVTAKPS